MLWVIQSAVAHPEIDEWRNSRGKEVNTLLWYREEYLVILGRRNGYWLLRSAYCTDKSGRIAQREGNVMPSIAAECAIARNAIARVNQGGL